MAQHPLLKIVRGAVVDLPTPRNLSYWWNLGSLLGLCLIVQILTGLFLSMHYTRDVRIAFERVRHIMRDVNFGWGIRIVHANGARFFFISLYLHVGRGLYYGSFLFVYTWGVGVVLLLLVMAAAFIGYVLPWGQMSFWGATVITNLFSAIPFIGREVVNWVWGGFAVDNATLGRFYSFHFLIPFLVLGGVVIHLFFLHQTGSNNPLGLSSNHDKIPFHPYFRVKDSIGFVLILGVLFSLSLLNPWGLGDPENFIPANPLVTPIHIQPEWYFLFAYAILRSIPNKLGGVIALAISVIILGVMIFMGNSKFLGIEFYPHAKAGFWVFRAIVGVLMWVGARPVEAPYILTGQVFTVRYFIYFLIYPKLVKRSEGWI